MEMSTRWGKEIMWRCFLACAITIVVVREAINICSTHGHCKSLQWGSFIWFQLKFPTPYEQVWAIILLAVVGGYLGCLYISFNTWVCVVWKKWTKFMWARIAKAAAGAATAKPTTFACQEMVVNVVRFFFPEGSEDSPEARHVPEIYL
ncbi:hypothetical protein Vretifemale_16473 [Volvox reticuliferus]|uniref:Uncharacterized protein n=1 Tax=Volvox reticuliferus TaxID=1737510 RepID=A0A8J4CRJ8_9CHLO|nr:hypothetical protein Vretifemale_16473 [Volvox reticuliferus]